MPKQTILRIIKEEFTKVHVINCNEEGFIFRAGYLIEIYKLHGTWNTVVCWSYNKFCGLSINESKLIL